MLLLTARCLIGLGNFFNEWAARAQIAFDRRQAVKDARWNRIKNRLDAFIFHLRSKDMIVIEFPSEALIRPMISAASIKTGNRVSFTAYTEKTGEMIFYGTVTRLDGDKVKILAKDALYSIPRRYVSLESCANENAA